MFASLLEEAATGKEITAAMPVPLLAQGLRQPWTKMAVLCLARTMSGRTNLVEG
jgi:hypothetical protein